MSAFTIEVAQGCVKTWSKTFAHEPTVQNVIDAIKADPKSFKGKPDLCDYRMKPEDELLSLDTKLQSGRLFAKKRDGKKKSATGSSSTRTRVGASRTTTPLDRTRPKKRTKSPPPSFVGRTPG
jgi:hypothetical protein